MSEEAVPHEHTEAIVEKAATTRTGEGGGLKADAVVLYGAVTRAMRLAEIKRLQAEAEALADDLRENARLTVKPGRPAVGNIARSLFQQRRDAGIPLPMGRSGQLDEAKEIWRIWPENGPPRPMPATISEHISQVYQNWRRAINVSDKR